MENSKKYVIGIISAVLLVASLAMLGNIVEHIDNGEILVIQDAVDGDLHVYSTAGYHQQWFGTPTHYIKSFQFSFEKPSKSDPNAPDKSIKIRFNDGGHADVSGSVRINLPIDDKSVIKFHTDYRSQEGIEQQLIRPAIEKSVYMTGPLMSSKESNAERRADLMNYMEDQASLGVYRTKTVEGKAKDELSGTEKTVSSVKIQEDSVTKIIKRQEISPLKTYNIILNTLSLNSIDYDVSNLVFLSGYIFLKCAYPSFRESITSSLVLPTEVRPAPKIPLISPTQIFLDSFFCFSIVVFI